MAAATNTTQGMKGMRYAVAAMALHVCGAFQQPRALRAKPKMAPASRSRPTRTRAAGIIPRRAT